MNCAPFVQADHKAGMAESRRLVQRSDEGSKQDQVATTIPVPLPGQDCLLEESANFVES